MSGMRGGKPRLDVKRLDAHPAHQAAYPVTPHVMASCPQLIADLPAAVERVRQMDLVDLTHQLPILRAQRNRPVVDARPAQIQKLALPGHGKIIRPVDHFFALGSPMRPSATDKKSFSIDSCPILA